MASGFLKLPVELIIYILLELTDSDIATFRMVRSHPTLAWLCGC